MAATTSAKRSESPMKEATDLLTLLSGVLVGLKKSPPKTTEKHDELRDAFEKSELGERHIAPLIALVIGGPASVGELAERIGLTPATTSLLVGELSRAGFVQRQEDEADRRRTIVSVDKSIEDAVLPSLGQTLEPLDRALGRMSAAQRRHFMDALRIVNEEMRSSEGDGSC